MNHERSNDVDKMVDEIMLPGFRFHPTDEELVGFYLKRKIQQRPLSIELIKQLDIYKYDPWDLPKMATTWEKEWYFYCPRDRKYRNSARPNRVTGAGFWKATGTDRPIYSSGGNKCIGLKKSLVFYKGRAAKGIKTDWMMHEFRLPSLTDSVATKRFIDNKNIPINDSWAICRIFKKTNSTAQRALSHSWVSPLPESTISVETIKSGSQMTQLSSQNMLLHYSNQILQQQQQAQSSSSSFSPLDFSFDKPAAGMINPMASKLSSPPPLLPISNAGDIPSNIFSSSLDHHQTLLSPSMMFNLSSSILGEDYGSSNGYSLLPTSSLPQVMQGGFGNSLGEIQAGGVTRVDDQWVEGLRGGMGLSFNLPMMGVGVGDHGFSSWNITPNNNNLIWDSNSPCPSDQMSTSLMSTTTKCFT